MKLFESRLMRLLALIGCAIILSACSGGTSYQIAPSTTKVVSKVATAKRSTQESVKRTKELAIKVKETELSAEKTAQHIAAATVAVENGDKVSALLHLIAARASNELVKMLSEQSTRDVASLKSSLETTERDLVDAEKEVEVLGDKLNKIVLQGAADRAIVEEVNWGFRIGALLYFVKGILKMGFIGAIILVVVGIVLLVLAATVGGPFLKFGGWLLGLFRRRKPG